MPQQKRRANDLKEWLISIGGEINKDNSIVLKYKGDTLELSFYFNEIRACLKREFFNKKNFIHESCTTFSAKNFSLETAYNSLLNDHEKFRETVILNEYKESNQNAIKKKVWQ